MPPWISPFHQVRLYARSGLREVSRDPAWRRALGGRVRLLMHKRLGESGLVNSWPEGEVQRRF